MTGKRDSFPENVAVTLTGDEWVAVLCHLDGMPLSPKAEKMYAVAFGKLQIQIFRGHFASLQQGGKQ
jgi:hypothetical protein